MASNVYHYVYRITNLSENKHYYGSRTSKVPPKLDIGFKYFTSSSDTEFREDFKNNPHMYKVKIVSEYKTRKEALSHEIILHTRFNVKQHPSFYNKCNATSDGFSMQGVKKPFKNLSKLHCKNLSISRTGKSLTKKHREAIGNGNKGKIVSEECKQKMRCPKPKATCPHCNKTGGIANMKQWHFDKCPVHTGIKHIVGPRGPQPNMRGPKPTVTCPNCNKTGGSGSMGRWHFDNCKYR